MVFIRKYLLVFLLVLSACSGHSQSSDSKSLPSWYVNPSTNSSMSLYGVGDGFTLQEASASALNNLASKLSVTISSDSSSLLEENKYSANEEFRKKINEKVKEIKFNNYLVSNSAVIGEKFFVEVKVDREQFITQQKEDLAANNNKMKEIYDSANGQNILIRKSKLDQINGIADKSILINEILKSLGANADFDKNITKYKNYQSELDKILDKIEFVVKADNQKVKDAMVQALNLQKFKVVPNVTANNNLAVLTLRTSSDVKNVYNSNITNLQVNIEVSSDQGKVVSGNLVEVIGASVGGKDMSFSAAVKSFSKKIEEENILKIIGIK